MSFEAITQLLKKKTVSSSDYTVVLSKLFVSQINERRGSHTIAKKESGKEVSAPFFLTTTLPPPFTPSYFHISIFHLCIQITYLNTLAVMIKKPYAPRA
jgi:hypothetical protein